MRKLTLLLTVLVAIGLFMSCGSKDSGSKEEDTKAEQETKKDPAEPKTVEEFKDVLDNFGIALYEGSTIEGVDEGSSTTLTTFVPSDQASQTEIMKHYSDQVNSALSGREKWTKHMESSMGIGYRKGYTGWYFGVVVNNMKTDKGYKVELTYGDNAVSY